MKLTIRLITCACVLLLATTVIAQADVTGTVYQTTNVRSGPDTRFEIIGQLSEGDEVIIDGRDAQSRWLHVILPDGEGGWLPVFALIIDGDVRDVPVFVDDQSTPSPRSDVAVIAYGRVNVRSGPGIAFAIIGELDVSESAKAVARSNEMNDWLMISLDDTEGWVAYFTVRVQGDVETLPVLVPDNTGESLIPPSRIIRTRFNVRLHEQPTLASAVPVTVPFDSEVTAIARTPSGDWLYVGFGEQTGWGAAQLFDIALEDIQDLPLLDEDSDLLPTPEVTAES